MNILSNQFHIDDKLEFTVEMHLLKIYCIYNFASDLRKILSRIVIALNILLNLYFFCGLLKYIFEHSRSRLELSESVGPFVGTISVITNFTVLFMKKDELLEIFSWMQDINRKCEYENC